MNTSTDFLVVLTSGKQDRGTRATLAFGWACCALAMGKTCAMYLTMDGTYWAAKGAATNVNVDGFEPLKEYVEQFFDLGGSMLVCAPCTEYYCSLEPSTSANPLLPQAQLSGLATIVGKVGLNTSVITF